jgi:beta-galactosidase
MASQRAAFSTCWLLCLGLLLVASEGFVTAQQPMSLGFVDASAAGRDRTGLNAGWKFQRFTTSPDNLSYDKLKEWILPSANAFIADTSRHHQIPSTQPANVSLAEATLDDTTWETVNLPHDWAPKGPFYTEPDAVIGGNMGRLPIQGIGWYRRKFSITPADKGKSIYLDIDGAMSYAVVWLNGRLVGGWPYGYASFRVDLTPYITEGDNQLAIRVDNALDSSRFYPGAGIYRNVWLVKAAPIHVAQWGSFITSQQVSAQSATLDVSVQIANSGPKAEVEVVTDIHVFGASAGRAGEKVGQFPKVTTQVEAGKIGIVNASVILQTPRLWGPRPSQEPNLYVAITHLSVGGQLIDSYETRFGIRSVEYKNDGIWVNGHRVYLQGVCQHHDLGSLGAAFNTRAAARQLEVLQDMGANAVRTAHNPPAPELLDLADEMGILILDEIFDTWQNQKVKNDFHLIFNDWHEADLRAFLRRDRNHPSIVMWSYGNEIAEQGNGQAGAAVAKSLQDIVHQEDSTRLATVGMNIAGPDSAFTAIVDIIGLNYQGEGIGPTADPTFASYRSKFPNKMIFSTESSSAISSRGTFLFPVSSTNSASWAEDGGSDSKALHVSSYDLYAVGWGASPDKVFQVQDMHPYVAGEFVWTGWDYLGEPTPYDLARSSYFGIIDLAGVPKDRFYLYQSRWNPTVKMAHILPHWNWPERLGQVTPVHVYSSGDEAELFLNGKSQGRIQKEQYQYRFRWDRIMYEPGELSVITYKGGQLWANATVWTTGNPKGLRLTSYRDRTFINADGNDLAFISLAVVDEKGHVIPDANNTITFSVRGPGEILTTDNGDPTDMNSFPSKERKAFNGYALAIVRAHPGASEPITITATAKDLQSSEITLQTR